jgi:hypothetical protein
MHTVEDDHAGLVRAYRLPNNKNRKRTDDNGDIRNTADEVEMEKIEIEEIETRVEEDNAATDGGYSDLLGENETEFGEMVQEPQRVTVEPIKHAKVASKVDVKALKAIMWAELRTLLQEGEREVEFGTVLEKVHPKVKDIGEVSAAMCFICMLHLCNEKRLLLSQHDIDHLVVSEC